MERRQSLGIKRTKSRKWGAVFGRRWLGSFKTFKEAARAYAAAALEEKRGKGISNSPETVLNPKALLDPNKALHNGPPPHPPVVPTLSAAIVGPVPNNFNNVGTDPTPNYGRMDPHMSNIRQQVNPSDVSPLNEDLQTFLSELLDDFTKWEESEQSSAQNPNQALHIGPPPHRLVVPTLSAAIGGPVPNNFVNLGAEMSSHFLVNPTPNYGHMDPHMSNIRQQVNPSDVGPLNLQTFVSELEQSSAQELEEFWRSILAENPL